MKKLFVCALIALPVITLLTGCLDLQLGGGSSTKTQSPTVGQQLLDLKKARDSGAINEQEYELQKQKILVEK